MTITTHPATTHPAHRGHEVHERAEFDPQALAEPTFPIPGPRQPAPDPRPAIAAVGVGVEGALISYALPARAGARARTLSILTGVPDSAWRGHAEIPERACAGLEVVRLDRDLDLWFDIDGAERHPRNPVASVIAAGFGVHGGIWGPVVFTGAPDEHGITCDVFAAAVVLIAGIAASCDRPGTGAARRHEFAALGLEVVQVAPGAGEEASPAPLGEQSYDSQRHTVTRDGDLPRCAECDEPAPHGHDECQPEAGAPAPY